MANSMFPLSRQAFGNGLLNFTGQDWRAALIDDLYVYDDLHEFYDDVAANVIAVSANLTTKTNVAGVMDADDVTFPTITLGQAIGGIILYQWTGSTATSRVVIHYDTTAAAQMIDVTADGGDVICRWSNGTTKMFRL